MLKLLLIAALAAMVAGQKLEEKGSLDDLLGDVFTKEPQGGIINTVTQPTVNQPTNPNGDNNDNDGPTVSLMIINKESGLSKRESF